MPGQRGRPRKSGASSASTPPMQCAPPRLVPTKNTSTPGHAAKNKPAVISLAQKQALIDNLQLEITERARKLRAQYALQAQGLRTRLEIRVGRIPAALRKATIGELLEKHASQALKDKESTTAGAVPPMRSPTKIRSPAKFPAETQAKAAGVKRKSDELYANKENAAQQAEDETPSKRSRPAPQPASRNVSKRVVQPSQVLSPKSTNARTIPSSPMKSGFPSPMKSNIARPVSPLKPSVAAPTATSLAKGSAVSRPKTASNSRVVSRQANTTATRGKKVAVSAQRATTDDDGGRDSNGSATSAGTTIMKKVTRPAAAAKKTVIAKPSIKGKRVAAAAGKIEAAAAAATGGRTLRKRA